MHMTIALPVYSSLLASVVYPLLQKLCIVVALLFFTIDCQMLNKGFKASSLHNMTAAESHGETPSFLEKCLIPPSLLL